MDTQKDIRDAIGAALPGLANEVMAAVEDALEKLGTTTRDDLRFITEGDLLPVLKPIQARRLVAAWAQNSKYLVNKLLCNFCIKICTLHQTTN